MNLTLENILIGETGSRLCAYDRWLVWNEYNEAWEVYESSYRRSTGKIRYSGKSLDEAMQILIKE